MSDDISDVLDWLHEVAPEKARTNAKQLARAGVAGVLHYGESSDGTVAMGKSAALAALTVDALDGLLTRFDTIHAALVQRLRTARRLRIGAALATTLSGSATLTALVAQALPPISVGFSGLTLIAALATVVAEYKDRQEALSEYTASVERIERARLMAEDLKHGLPPSESVA